MVTQKRAKEPTHTSSKSQFCVLCICSPALHIKCSSSKQWEISSSIWSGLTSNTETWSLSQTVTVLLYLSTRMGHPTLHTLPLTVTSDVKMNEFIYYTVMRNNTSALHDFYHCCLIMFFFWSVDPVLIHSHQWCIRRSIAKSLKVLCLTTCFTKTVSVWSPSSKICVVKCSTVNLSVA